MKLDLKTKSADTYVAKNLHTLQTEPAISYYQSLALFFLSPPNIHGRALPLPLPGSARSSSWYKEVLPSHCRQMLVMQLLGFSL